MSTAFPVALGDAPRDVPSNATVEHRRMKKVLQNKQSLPVSAQLDVVHAADFNGLPVVASIHIVLSRVRMMQFVSV